MLVAPARERGLKLVNDIESAVTNECRSREGAWIEIALFCLYILYQTCRSREGAWIEMAAGAVAGGISSVAPARERGLKFRLLVLLVAPLAVAPARERGLKSQRRNSGGSSGRCRSREGAWIEIRICGLAYRPA